MTLKLNGSSSGSVSIDAPAATTGGADVTLTLPVNDGDANQYLQTNGSGALVWASPLTQLAATTTSGADNYTWESIPAGFKRLTMIFTNVSMSGTDAIKIELGGGSYYTSNYLGTSGFIAGTSGNAQEFASTDAFYAYQAVAAKSISGHAIITPGTTGTSATYVYSFQGTHEDGSAAFGAGSLTGVSDAITKVKIRSSGSNTFDAGTVSIMYEM